MSDVAAGSRRARGGGAARRAERTGVSFETARFIDGIARMAGVRITTPLDPTARSGIVTFEIGDYSPSEVVSALWYIDRIVARVCNDRRARVCFHIFNDEQDVDRAVAALEQIATHGLPAGTLSEDEYKTLLAEAYD